MNPKTAKFYDSIFTLAKTDYINDHAALKKAINFMLDYSYEGAVEFWEYLISKNDLSKPAAGAALGNNVFEQFWARNQAKAQKTLLEHSIIMSAYFGANPEAAGRPCKMIFGLILSNKTQQAEVAMSYLSKNTASSKPYPEMLRGIIDGVIARALSKAGGEEGAVILNKKQHGFLKAIVAKLKLKNADRQLLEQRLTELAPTNIYGDD